MEQKQEFLIQDAQVIFIRNGRVSNSAIEWINKQDNQWFTWLAYTAPHSPIHLPPEHLHTYSSLSGGEGDLKRNKEKYFMAMLESVDSEIGRLLDSFDAETRNNTYVVIIGDNGTSGLLAQEPYKSVGSKGTLHAGGINTPMLIYNPYVNGKNTHFDSMVSTIDFYPTILDMLGLNSVAELDGNSVYPLVSDKISDYKSHTYVYSQNLEELMVKTLEYKLIQHINGEEKFYDLQSDPFEEINLLLENMNNLDRAAYNNLSEVLQDFLKNEA